MISDKLFKWTTHSKLKKSVVTVLEGLSCHVQPIEHLGNRGVFDINCCYMGREFWVEIKIKPDTLSPTQQSWLSKRQRAGGVCSVLSADKGIYILCYDNITFQGELTFVLKTFLQKLR